MQLLVVEGSNTGLGGLDGQGLDNKSASPYVGIPITLDKVLDIPNGSSHTHQEHSLRIIKFSSECFELIFICFK